jgi:hypothetical protein
MRWICRVAVLATFGIAIGCGGGGGDTSTDTDGGEDGGTDTDTDADGGEDGGTNADTDTDTDTGPDLSSDDCPDYDRVVFVNGGLGDYSGHDGSSWESALAEVQAGLDAAASLVAEVDAGTPECAVWVAAGIYLPTAAPDGDPVPIDERTKTFQLRQGVALYGGFDGAEASCSERDIEANETTLSGDLGVVDAVDDNAYHVVTGIDGAVIDGFTITGGNAQGDIPVESGGGMYLYEESSDIIRCAFEGNHAALSGAGVFASDSSPTIAGCSFIDNSADRAGGGVGLGDGAPRVTRCFFEGNTAMYGGGIANSSLAATVTDCVFTNNSVEGWDSWVGLGGGGGVVNDCGAMTLVNCVFAENSAQFGGGGVDNSNSSVTMVNCSFSGNTAEQGGGVLNKYPVETTMTGCVLWGNSATGSGSEISIVWGGGGETATVSVSYSDVQGGCDAIPGAICGDGNIDDDPLFADVEVGDLRLQPESTCIDTGSNAALPSGVTTDLDGNPRITDGDGDSIATVDMGAYEHQL